MTGGVSVGWFDPSYLVGDVDFYVANVRETMSRLPISRDWPLQVSTIRRDGETTGVSHAIVGGHIPIHIDSKGPNDPDTRIFQFVVHVENRPALLTQKAERDKQSMVIMGNMPFGTFGLGGMPMAAGSFIHFDIATHWHAVTQLPLYGDDKVEAPKAVIVQVSGFAAEEYEKAIEHAKAELDIDRPWWAKYQHRVKA